MDSRFRLANNAPPDLFHFEEQLGALIALAYRYAGGMTPISAAQQFTLDIFGPIGVEPLTARSVIKALDAIPPRIKTIAVRIASDGRAVGDAVAIYNALRGHPAKIEIEIVGWALSCASFIAMAGDTVRMAENSLMMIHSPWSGLEGNADELRRHADILDMAKEAMIGAYSRKTGKSREAIVEIMSKESWFDASQAIAFGLIDEITAPIQMAASMRQSCRFRIPDIYSKDMTMNDTPNATVQSGQQSEIELQGEIQRRDAIHASYAPFMSRAGVPELYAKAIGDKATTIEAARAGLLKELRKNSGPMGGGFLYTEDKRFSDLHEGAVDAILARSGIHVDKPSPLAADFRRHRLVDYAQDILSMAGKRVDGGPSEVIKAAMSTADFPKLLENVAGKALQMGYADEVAGHEAWTAEREVADFKLQSLVALSEAPQLEEVVQGAEYRYGSFAESAETFQVKTYGKIIKLTRQAIINDDLGAFTMMPQAFGASARRLEADIVYGKLTANAALADGVALFHANHNNLLGATTLDLAGLAAARAKMRAQKGIAGAQFVDPVPRVLVVPVALETAAEQLISSLIVPAAAANANVEWIRNLTVVANPRLDAVSATVWYLAAGPQQIQGITRAYLLGEARPFIEQQNGFERDALAVKCRLDFAAGVVDYRALLRVG